MPGEGVSDLKSPAPQFHAMDQEEVLEFWEVDPEQGLSKDDVRNRRYHFGCNELPSRDRPDLWGIFARQWEDFMVLVLLGATAIAFFLGEHVEAIVILAIVVVNAILGFLQEYKAEAALMSLAKMASQKVKVRRDGVLKFVDSSELVPGDIVVLAPGDQVPADARLLGNGEGACDEAILTGESVPVGKGQTVVSEDAHLTDRRNMVYHGTGVVNGGLTVVVVATGLDTELGAIASMLEEEAEDDQPPLQRNLERLGHVLLVGCLLISALIVILGVLRGKPPYDMFLAGVSLAVAAIPEGLPAVVTVALAMGVQRMASQKAVVRNLHSVETLGCATVICSDKTGTLTANHLELEIISIGGRNMPVGASGRRRPESFWRSLLYGAWCSDVEMGTGGEGFERPGDPTDLALVEAAEEMLEVGPARLLSSMSFNRAGSVPFASSRRCMSVWGTRVEKGQKIPSLLVKGAPETVMQMCSSTWALQRKGVSPLTGSERQRLLGVVEDLSGRGYRLLALAERTLSSRQLREGVTDEQHKNLTLVGFLALLDPPRPEGREALRECAAAGVHTIMITGDHPLTARAVAQRLGMIGENGSVATGDDLDRADRAELRYMVRKHRVFARVTPGQKLRIVRALRDAGHVVVMTGDGVNDAPALKEAHIGVAMGLTGTDVTRKVADLILLDDNFASIVAAIREGRGVFRNIRKFIYYLLSCNIGELLLMLAATLVNLPHPLLPTQILLVNLVTDGLPAMALGMEPSDASLMNAPPRNVRASVFSGALGSRIMGRGLLIGLVSMANYALFIAAGSPLEQARTVALVTIVLSQLIHACETHYMGGTTGTILATNPGLAVAVLSSFGILLAVLYVPALAGIMRLVPLDVTALLICAGAAVVGPVAERVLLGITGRRLVVET